MVAQADAGRNAAGLDLGPNELARLGAAFTIPAVGAEARNASAAVGTMGRNADRQAGAQVPHRVTATVAQGLAATVARAEDNRRRGLTRRHLEDARLADVATGVDTGPVRLARRPLAGQRRIAPPMAPSEVARQANGRTTQVPQVATAGRLVHAPDPVVDAVGLPLATRPSVRLPVAAVPTRVRLPSGAAVVAGQPPQLIHRLDFYYRPVNNGAVIITHLLQFHRRRKASLYAPTPPTPTARAPQRKRRGERSRSR